LPPKARECARSAASAPPAPPPGTTMVTVSNTQVSTSARLTAVAFGQQAGPPASSRQVQQLLALLKDAGHTDFRDARGPMGFTQRQAGGKFTRDEASAFIDKLTDREPGTGVAEAVPAATVSAQQQLLRHMPAELLAAELRRRGWTVDEP
jgi:hypothetical protein